VNIETENQKSGGDGGKKRGGKTLSIEKRGKSTLGK